MGYRIALNFEDGATRFIDCNDGETVLDAAFRQKVNLPMDCSDGVCGTCKCHCERGSYDLGEDYIDEALTEDEAAEGKVLTCQMRVDSDCVVERTVAGVMVEVRTGQHHRSPGTLQQDVLGWPSHAPALAVAPAASFPIPPSSIPQMKYPLSMRAPTMLAATFCPHEAHVVRKLRPVDRV